MKKHLLKLTFLTISLLGLSGAFANCPVNLALTATANHSGGGAGIFGPANYNDGVIVSGTFGWVSTTGNPSTSSWYEYRWSSSQRIQRIRIFNDQTLSRCLTGGTVQVWNGSVFTNVLTFSVGASLQYDVVLPTPQTTTIIRITNHVTSGTQTSNPAVREIQVFGPPPTWDAQVSSVNIPDMCSGTQNISAVIQNGGRNAWDSVLIGLQVNGVTQSSTWFRQRVNSGSSVNINVASFNFSGSGDYVVRVFATSPNNFSDSLPCNDTFRRVQRIRLQPNTTSVVDQTQCGTGFGRHVANTQTGMKTLWFGRFPNPLLLGMGDNINGRQLLYSNGTTPRTYQFDALTHSGFLDTLRNLMTSTTSYAGGTAADKGYFWDMRPKANLVFTQLDVSISDPNGINSYDVDFYYRRGTSEFNESNPAGWVLFHSQRLTNGAYVAPGGAQPVQRVDIPDMYLRRDTLYAFYMVVRMAAPSLRTNCAARSTALQNDFISIERGALSAAGAFSFTLTRGFFPEIRVYTEPGCISTSTAVQTITVNPRPIGAEAAKSTPFQSTRPNTLGLQGDPDIVSYPDTISHTLTPPTGYSNSDHGSRWNITAISVTTRNGFMVPTGNYRAVVPSGSSPAKFWFFPDKNLTDSLIAVRITFQDNIGYNCDSTVTRWIRVAPRADVDFKFSTPTCDGEDVLFENLSTVTSGGMNYKWYFGDGDSSDAKNPVHRYAGHGSYNCRLVVTTDPYEYVTSKTITVNVTEIPKVNFTRNNACVGGSTQFTNTTTYGGAGTVTYDWDFGDGVGKSTQRNPSYKYARTGGYPVTLKATVNGCSNSITKNTYLFDRPVAAYDLPAGKNCAREGLAFNNKSSIANGRAGNLWDFGDGTIGTVEDPVHNYATNGSYSVRLISISEFGCADTVTKTLVVNEKPTASFTFGQVCLNRPVLFSNTSQHSMGLNPQYFWRFSDGQTSATRDASRTWNVPSPRTVTLAVIPFNGCVDSVSATVIPGILPDLNFSTQDACSGQEVNLANFTTAPQGNVVYDWDFGDGNTSTQRVPKPVYNVSTTRTYNVKLKAQVIGGCMDSLVKTVTIFELPKCDFTINDIYKPGHRAFSFNPSVTNYPYYRWTFGEGGNSNAANAEYQYTYDGPFTVTLTARNSVGCECSSTRQINVLNLGIADLNGQTIRFYPNPASELLNVDMDIRGKASISLIDASGRTVLVRNLDASKSVNVAGLPAGVYQAMVQMDGAVASARIVISR